MRATQLMFAAVFQHLRIAIAPFPAYAVSAVQGHKDKDKKGIRA
jgi:hypothetical protein